MTSKNLIINASELVEHLRELKKLGIPRWWQNILIFRLDKVRKSTSNTKWCNISNTDRTDAIRLLNIRIAGEKHIEKILPNTDEDAAKLNEKKKNSKIIYTNNNKKPTLKIQQWATKVQTADDDITILKGDNEEAVLPTEKFRSEYYAIAEYLNEAFFYEVKELTVASNIFKIKLSLQDL